MRVIKPSATILKHEGKTPYEFVEMVGRTCYKSEDLITDVSAEKFVGGLISREHWAMLEHETIYLVVSEQLMEDLLEDMEEYIDDLKFFNITMEIDSNIISGSFRSFHDLFEKGHISYPIQYMEICLQSKFPLVFGKFNDDSHPYYDEFDCTIYSRQEFLNRFTRPDILFKHLTHTVKFVCDRGVSHEFVRHRTCSFAQESTRYCNYSKEKFGREITVIEPCFFELDSVEDDLWFNLCMLSESNYFRLLDIGSTPQEARSVLPNSLKTELIITATEEEWQHIVNLRYLGTTGKPHPQMKEVMSLIVEELGVESEGRIKYETNKETN